MTSVCGLRVLDLFYLSVITSVPIYIIPYGYYLVCHIGLIIAGVVAAHSSPFTPLFYFLTPNVFLTVKWHTIGIR